MMKVRKNKNVKYIEEYMEGGVGEFLEAISGLIIFCVF